MNIEIFLVWVLPVSQAVGIATRLEAAFALALRRCPGLRIEEAYTALIFGNTLR